MKKYKYVQIAILLIGWQILGYFNIIDNSFFSYPSKVFFSFIKLVEEGIILHLIDSLFNITIAFIIALIFGFTIGLLSYYKEKIYYIINPWIDFFNIVPIISLTPIFLLIFGFGVFTKILVITLITIPPIFYGVYNGFKNINSDYILLSKAYKLNKKNEFIKILFFGALPEILNGIKIGLGKSVIGLIVAELFGYSKGIGFLLTFFNSTGNIEGLIIVSIMLLFIGLGINKFIIKLTQFIINKYHYEIKI